MFEHATLQEAYTGSLIAGKGKSLNNIKVIMERTRLKTEDWTRVRFGAGTPWRRCWCVISPPDEKEVQKLQKSLKKKSVYDRSLPTLKGNVKFYDTKKTKKAHPIATINDAYSAYAIYPQSKPLIDQSTLVKVEGSITIHSTPETTTDGFVFVMPEAHPGVTGFEMMLRWLFPLFDVFGLYGRPNRLIADTLDTRSLMFALPQERRYGYLEILDVATLIHESGSPMWNEKEWRARLKDLTSSRITKLQSSGSRQRSRASSYRGHRNSLPSRAGTLRYEDGASIRSSPSFHNEPGPPLPIHTSGSAPPAESPFTTPARPKPAHQRSVSDVVAFYTPQHQKSQRSIHDNQSNYTPSRLSYEAPPVNGTSESPPPLPPAHSVPVNIGTRNSQMQKYVVELEGSRERSSSESDRRFRGPEEPEAREIHQDLRPAPPLAPVVPPPAFAHEAGAKPQKRPHVSPELRRANSRMSISTLSQLADAGQLSPGGSIAAAGAAAAWKANGAQKNNRSPLDANGQPSLEDHIMRDGGYVEDHGQRGVIDDASKRRPIADHSSNFEGMALTEADRSPSENREVVQSPNLTDQHGSQFPNHNQLSSTVIQPDPDQSLNWSSRGMPNAALPNSASQRQLYEEFPASESHDTHNSDPPRDSLEYLAAAIDSDPINSREPQRPEMNRLNTGRSVVRKPLPPKSPPSVGEAPSPISRSSLESLRQHVIDEDVLDQIGAHDSDRIYAMDSSYDRQIGEGESMYDDESNISPDYASTRKSTETKRSKVSVEKPRAGKLKTVGTIEPVRDEVALGDMRYDPGLKMDNAQPAIPSVDFGPTQLFVPEIGGRSSTAGGLSESTNERPKSKDGFTASPRSRSPADVQGNGDGLLNRHHERSPSRNLVTPEPGRRTPSGNLDSDNRRSMAWQPGATIGGGSPGGRHSITPEQFVQQRAAANRITPVYAHGRKASGQGTPPTISRNPSGEWPLQHTRQASITKDLPSRPQSRGSQMILNPSGDYSAHLSAREQEHVARVTGSPLINMSSNTNRQAPQGGGLIGAIEAREREKKDIKEGLSSQMVQHAIAQRQQHGQQHSQSYHQTQQPFPSPSPQLPMPGQYPPSPGKMQPQYFGPSQQQYVGTPQQQYAWGTAQPQQGQIQQRSQQQWVSPAAQQYWSATQTNPYQQQQARQASQAGYQQQASYQQQAGHQQQAGYQQQPNGPYFGNGQGGR